MANLMTLAELHRNHALAERRLLLSRLVKCEWHYVETARTLGTTETWVRRAIERHKLGEFRPAETEHRGRPRKQPSRIA